MDANEVELLKKKIDGLNQRIRDLETVVFSVRTNIDNLEGNFKILTAEPTASDTNWDEGSLILTDVSGTRKLFVRINQAWYSVEVT